MPRAIWKGAISFGLVNIPIALYPATRREELKFKMLRKGDLSPINYKRVAEADGKEVPWDEIVKGYEYEKGKFVILTDEDFQRIDIEATQTVDIKEFVDLEEVDPVFFQKPYYMEPMKGGDKAYALLRGALEDSGMIGIAKVVIKTKQHLAGIKPHGKGLMLELMHFEDELVPLSEFKAPELTSIGHAELKMAQNLIGAMTAEWNPSKHRDNYRESLEKVIEEKVSKPDKAGVKATARTKATNVVDIVALLQESVAAAGGGSKAKKPAKTKPGARTTHKKAA